jgi:hypothetical protein
MQIVLSFAVLGGLFNKNDVIHMFPNLSGTSIFPRKENKSSWVHFDWFEFKFVLFFKYCFTLLVIFDECKNCYMNST